MRLSCGRGTHAACRSQYVMPMLGAMCVAGSPQSSQFLACSLHWHFGPEPTGSSEPPGRVFCFLLGSSVFISHWPASSSRFGHFTPKVGWQVTGDGWPGDASGRASERLVTG